MSRDEYLEKFNNTEFYFEMFTPEGNDKVKEIISEALYKMFYDVSSFLFLILSSLPLGFG